MRLFKREKKIYLQVMWKFLEQQVMGMPGWSAQVLGLRAGARILLIHHETSRRTVKKDLDCTCAHTCLAAVRPPGCVPGSQAAWWGETCLSRCSASLRADARILFAYDQTDQPPRCAKDSSRAHAATCGNDAQASCPHSPQSFPLTEEEYMQQLDAVCEYLTEWGVADT